MNKECSFLIILIIGYISYNYCSITVEGINPNVNQGYYKTSQDRSDLSPESIDLSDPENECSSDKDPHNRCKYIDKDCHNIQWDRDKYRFKDDSNPIRRDCMNCIMVSNELPIMASYLSDIGNYSSRGANPNPKSKFSMNYCDAIVANCDDYYFYALGSTNFEDSDCNGIDDANSDAPLMTKVKCSVLTNSIFNFFSGIIRGVECELTIRLNQLRDKAVDLEDSIESSVEDKFTSIVRKAMPGIPGT